MLYLIQDSEFAPIIILFARRSKGKGFGDPG